MSDSYDAMPAEARNGYDVWVAGGMRSWAKTAELLGIPAGTVRSWAYRYQWRTLVKDSDNDTVRGSVEAAVLLSAAQHQRNVEAAVACRDDPAAKWTDRLKAIEWLSSIGGLVPTQRIEFDRGSEEAKGESLAVGELIALASAGNFAALIAIAQGRTPSAALPASTADYSDDGDG